MGKVILPLRPFFIWGVDQDKEIFHATTQIGLGDIKSFLCTQENHTRRLAAKKESQSGVVKQEGQKRKRGCSPDLKSTKWLIPNEGAIYLSHRGKWMEEGVSSVWFMDEGDGSGC